MISSVWYNKNLISAFRDAKTFMLTFSPKTVTKDFLAELPERSKNVIQGRYGLISGADVRTLDAIGREYGITRERIRQIENHGLGLIRESDAYAAHLPKLEDLKRAVDQLGGIVSEELILDEVPKSDAERSHVLFLLTVGHHFEDRRETADFHRRWHTDRSLAEAVERALGSLHESVGPDALIPEDEFIELFAQALKDEGVKPKEPEILTRWLALSKRLGRNPLGEWGRADSPHVRLKNTRDYAYLTLKRHGSPMHFTEVAQGIKSIFKRLAHPATTHNELIKDTRFVLVGRGLYALKEWGYQPGVVRDVIRAILEREGALSREDIVDRVKRERYVKDATITVNLQSGIFVKDADGKFTVVK